MLERSKVPPRLPRAVRSFVSALSDGRPEGHDSFQALFEASPLPLVVSAVDTGEVVAVNGVAESLSGFSVDELRGRTVYDFGHYRDANDRETQIAEAEATPSAGREVRFQNARGEELRLLAHTSRIVLDGRECFLTAFTNVTALGRIDAGLLAAQRMEVIGKLSGGVAHEFNNLLTVMQGHLDAMTDDAHLPAAMRVRVDALGRAVAQATRITSGLLTFSGRNPGATSIIDLNAALAGLRSLITGTLGETIEVQWQLDASPATAMMADSHVAQVVLNLALNARDAMPEGGHLVIATSYVTEAESADGVGGPGPWVRLQMDDTGHGMSEEVQRHVFEPFFTTKAPGRGTGLGLSICRGIAEQAGGHIAVQSVPGSGTSVRLYVPWTQAPERTARLRTASPSGAKIVLLVEDEADVRHIVAEILRRAGHFVHEADGLASAELRCDTLPALDLLLTDLVLPGGNGLEVARRVRARYPGVPVLFMSGYSESVFAGGEAVERLLQKPFTSRTLLDTLDRLFEG